MTRQERNAAKEGVEFGGFDSSNLNGLFFNLAIDIELTKYNQKSFYLFLTSFN